MKQIVAALYLSLCAGLACAQAPRDEAALRACFARNVPQLSLSEDILLTKTTPDGNVRRLAGSWYWQARKDGQNGMLRLTLPKDLAGAAYLFLGAGKRQDYYLYLPTVKKVKHVTGATTAQSLFDTGLSAFDLKFLFSGLRGGRLVYLGKARGAARPSTLWRYEPPEDPDILYDRVDLTVDDAWCLATRVDLYGGVPWKILTVDATSVQKIQGRWLASVATLNDLRTRSTTRIELYKPKIDQALSPDLFHPKRFYLQR